MSIYAEDLKKSNPLKYADYVIAGGNSGVALKNMIKALSMMPMLNSPEENLRLAAAKRLLKNKY
jgi:phosphoribosylcarboxyaminoimidazole (NCAIR) mutase